jgi:PilZ domain
MVHDTQESTMTITTPCAIARNEDQEKESQDGQSSLGCGVAVLITTSRLNEAGIVQDIHPHALSILVRQAVPAGTEVSIEFGAVSSDGKVVACRPKGSRYELCIVIPDGNDQERRAAERFPVTEDVQIGIRNLESPLKATVVDVSAHGVGLETSTALNLGEIITVEDASCLAFGVVRYSRRLTEDRFHSGVEIFHILSKNAEE